MPSSGGQRYPVTAAAAATAGPARYTEASVVPQRPLKLRLEVRTDTPPLWTAWPIPTQGPQPHSRILAPASTKSERTPSSNII